MNRLKRLLFLLPVLGALSCGQNDDPEGAKALLAKVQSGAGFRAWERAPGFPKRMQSLTAHGDEVEIFVSPEIAAALKGPAGITQWPVGAIVAKEGFGANGGDRKIIALMEKRNDGWYWAEYDGDGEPLYSGKPTVCVQCHDNRKAYSDWVYGFEFPR